MESSRRVLLIALLLCFIVAGTSGCASFLSDTGVEKPELIVDATDEVSAKQQQAYVYTENPHEGSLWTPYNSRSCLFADNKARYINDIITIQITEASDASRNATTSVSRKGGMNAGISKFFGSDLAFGMDNLWGKTKGKT
ncbi:MAG: flagellar basal body L-ring protein FlgH, partial [Pseudomonadota bacterium]